MAVITVGTPADDAHRSRMTALADVHRRREALFGALRRGASSAAEPGGGDPLPDEFVPTRQALEAVLSGPSWGEKVDAKHRKAIRRVPGAVIHFPLVDGGVVDTFITDWSPLPGACAIAVHPGHELAAREGFTGKFVRHPLSGDLLPVWVADWVRPDFGTGAVVVNPAHSEADLDFARRIGLPVRFALADTPPTSDPTTWPDPPVVKRGRAPSGLPHDEAAQRYLEELRGQGHAELVELPLLGRVEVSDALRDLVAALRADPNATVIATAAAVSKELLWARVVLGGNATPTVVTDVPPVERYEAKLPELHRPEPPSEAGRALLRDLADGEVAKAVKSFRALRKSAGDPACVLIGAHVLFGTELPEAAREVVAP
jgi:hypothetical protein